MMWFTGEPGIFKALRRHFQMKSTNLAKKGIFQCFKVIKTTSFNTFGTLGIRPRFWSGVENYGIEPPPLFSKTKSRKKASKSSITFICKNHFFSKKIEKRSVNPKLFDIFEIFLGLEISAEKSRKTVNNCRKIKMPQKGSEIVKHIFVREKHVFFPKKLENRSANP